MDKEPPNNWQLEATLKLLEQRVHSISIEVANTSVLLRELTTSIQAKQNQAKGAFWLFGVFAAAISAALTWVKIQLGGL